MANKKENCENCKHNKNGYCEVFEDETAVILKNCTAFEEKDEI